MTTQTNLMLLQPGQLPAYAAAFASEHANIAPKATIPTLSMRGKVFRLVLGGEETPLTRVDENGDRVPLQTIRISILDFTKKRGRAYHDGAYVEGQSKPPACWSSNGERPDEAVQNPQCDTCAACPQSAKGSRVSADGRASRACASHRLVALVPFPNTANMEPVRIRLPITSLYDKQNKENDAKGWFAFEQYVEFLRSKGIDHTGIVVTKVKFDPDSAAPKLLFSAERLLDENELNALKPVINSEAVSKLLISDYAGVAAATSAAIAEVEDEEEPVPPPAPTVKAPVAKTPVAKAPVTPSPVPIVVPPPATELPFDDDEGDAFNLVPTQPVVVQPAVAAPAPQPVAAPTGTTDELDALLGEWAGK